MVLHTKEWDEGFEAGFDLIARAFNPYENGTPEFHEWNFGHEDDEAEEEKMNEDADEDETNC